MTDAPDARDVDEIDPGAAWQTLNDDPDALLVDVRSRAEWTFVGLPDLRGLGRPVLTVEWASFPAMAPNPGFVETLAAQLAEATGGRQPSHLLFLCRSGARSLAAARLTAASLADSGRPVRCTNVAEGFEGDLDAEGHRGRRNGWKARGLPWRQG